MATEPGIDYTREYPGSPGVGDEVSLDRPHGGHAGGRVVDILRNSLGAALVVEFADGSRADFHWQRCRPRFAELTRRYAGRIEGGAVVVTYTDGVSPDGSNPNAPQPFDPAPSLRLRNHSPDGFAWGYGGSGPAQLALALLLDATGGDVEAAQDAYQDFKWAFVSKWRREGPWEITAAEVRAWVAGRPPRAG